MTLELHEQDDKLNYFEEELSSFYKKMNVEISNVVRSQTQSIRSQIIQALGKGGMMFGEMTEEAGLPVVNDE